MIRVVCFKWLHTDGEKIPSMDHLTYGPEHVNVLRRMVERHLDVEHEFVCVTDDPEGLDPEIRVVPLWNTYRKLGGCYHRLRLFSEGMRELIGPRFVAIDLDCVIVGDITPLVTRDVDFAVNSYKPMSPRDPDQRYNGGMILMDAGARSYVWDSFGPHQLPAIEIGRKRKQVVGTDQAWMRLALPADESTFTEADGVYEVRQIRGDLPAGAKIIFFAGPRDPTTMTLPWIREHYR